MLSLQQKDGIVDGGFKSNSMSFGLTGNRVFWCLAKEWVN